MEAPLLEAFFFLFVSSNRFFEVLISNLEIRFVGIRQRSLFDPIPEYPIDAKTGEKNFIVPKYGI